MGAEKSSPLQFPQDHEFPLHCLAWLSESLFTGKKKGEDCNVKNCVAMSEKSLWLLCFPIFHGNEDSQGSLRMDPGLVSVFLSFCVCVYVCVCWHVRVNTHVYAHSYLCILWSCVSMCSCMWRPDRDQPLS